MQIAKRLPPAVPAHRISETETTVWVLIVILLGSISFAIACLLHQVGG
jgi:hypothetical protein